MIKTELIFDCDDSFLTRTVSVPFALVPGMEIVLDDPAWWSSFVVVSASWEAKKCELRCWVEFLGDDQADAAIERMIQDGWKKC